MNILLMAMAAATTLVAQPVATTAAAPEPITGAALLSPSELLTWGGALRQWQLPSLRDRKLQGGPFGEGGCTVDLDRDGRRELVVVAGEGLGKLVRMQPPEWTPETIDNEVEMHDCIEADLFGRRGVLMIQRGMQVRFYEHTPAGKWISRDIYSIYTPSYQGGLASHDVDEDGRPDILCGNYWIRSPSAFELPWRLFAINTWSETPDSSTMRLQTLDDHRLAVAQGHLSAGRIAIFKRPENPELQWPAQLLHRANYPHAVGRWQQQLIVGENNGAASRLFGFDMQGGELWTAKPGGGTHAVLALDEAAFLTVGPDAVRLWRQRPPRR